MIFRRGNFFSVELTMLWAFTLVGLFLRNFLRNSTMESLFIPFHPIMQEFPRRFLLIFYQFHWTAKILQLRGVVFISSSYGWVGWTGCSWCSVSRSDKTNHKPNLQSFEVQKNTQKPWLLWKTNMLSSEKAAMTYLWYNGIDSNWQIVVWYSPFI